MRLKCTATPVLRKFSSLGSRLRAGTGPPNATEWLDSGEHELGGEPQEGSGSSAAPDVAVPNVTQSEHVAATLMYFV